MSNLDGLSNFKSRDVFAKRVHTYTRVLEKVASRYAPSRLLSFNEVHVFMALQLIHARGHASRTSLQKELALGGGAVKTIVKHMQMNGLVQTSNGGTKTTPRGRSILEGLADAMPAEMPLPRSSISLGRYNYAVLLRELGFAIKSGIEQRDAAIRIGGTGATTLLCRDGGLFMQDSREDPLKKEGGLKKELFEKLRPADGDAVIIGGADSGKAAELAAKSAALATIMAHEKHA